MSFQRDPLAGKLPVSLITGFLGSGKTTLISKLVRHPDMNRVAVIINEIGEIGIDHDLVSMSSENVSLLVDILLRAFTSSMHGPRCPDRTLPLVYTTHNVLPA